MLGGSAVYATRAWRAPSTWWCGTTASLLDCLPPLTRTTFLESSEGAPCLCLCPDLGLIDLTG